METITLNSGTLSFTACAMGLKENAGAPLVLCLHGFPDNERTFRHQLPVLAEAGYRVIAPRMRGYEPSSQPEDGDYDVTSLAGDIRAWLDELGEQKVHLVGHDWGAIVSYVAGSLFSDRLHSLTTIAVPHAARFNQGVRRVPGQLRRSWYVNFFQIPGIAEHFVQRNDWALIRKLWRDWSPGYDMSDEDWADLRATLAAPGVKRAALGYYGQNASLLVLLGLRKIEASRLTTVPVRTLAITGAQDGCIDTRLYDHTFFDKDFPAGFRVERIDGAGHFAHLEAPEVVNPLLLEWFQRS
jgi:pimeloyl-ACP methyl ester carboxylesterase